MPRSTLSSFPYAGPSGSEAAAPERWWRHGMVWLVIATPSLAVAASVAVAILAWHDADVELSNAIATDATPAVRESPSAERAKAPTAPAMQARNHAATPRP